jgi:hypothetical protein
MKSNSGIKHKVVGASFLKPADSNHKANPNGSTKVHSRLNANELESGADGHHDVSGSISAGLVLAQTARSGEELCIPKSHVIKPFD